MMTKIAAVILLGAMLSGCSTAVFDARACPTERQYSRAEQTALADALPKSPHIVKVAIVDYGKLRDKARACRGER